MDIVPDAQRGVVIRFAVHNHKDKLFFVKDLVKGIPFAFDEIFQSIMGKAELSGEIQDTGHVGIVHPYFILGGKHIWENNLGINICKLVLTKEVAS